MIINDYREVSNHIAKEVRSIAVGRLKFEMLELESHVAHGLRVRPQFLAGGEHRLLFANGADPSDGEGGDDAASLRDDNADARFAPRSNSTAKFGLDSEAILQ